jgi:hypothetical protein
MAISNKHIIIIIIYNVSRKHIFLLLWPSRPMDDLPLAQSVKWLAVRPGLSFDHRLVKLNNLFPKNPEFTKSRYSMDSRLSLHEGETAAA